MRKPGNEMALPDTDAQNMMEYRGIMKANTGDDKKYCDVDDLCERLEIIGAKKRKTSHKHDPAASVEFLNGSFFQDEPDIETLVSEFVRSSSVDTLGEVLDPKRILPTPTRHFLKCISGPMSSNLSLQTTAGCTPAIYEYSMTLPPPKRFFVFWWGGLVRDLYARQRAAQIAQVRQSRV